MQHQPNGSTLRVYDPAECDEHGVPLDWERCRACGGVGRADLRNGAERPEWVALVLPEVGAPVNGYCGTCEGHGSLKAAALYRKFDHQIIRANNTRPRGTPMVDRSVAPRRCEGCGHPMSDGTWEGFWRPSEQATEWALVALHDGREPRIGGFRSDPADIGGARDVPVMTHWSPCDQGCRHAGPARNWSVEHAEAGETWVDPPPGFAKRGAMTTADVLAGFVRGTTEVQASWRQVDVRTLGWPHDLRPEKLAMLCLRCFASRTANTEASGA